jgi:predicted small secreted protein
MTRLILLIAAITSLTGCETVKGAGRDIQTAGATITSEAQKAAK